MTFFGDCNEVAQMSQFHCHIQKIWISLTAYYGSSN
jgi:hypothetical protein